MSAEMATQPHLRVFACRHVFERQKPVLLVSRADGSWCFLCGGQHEQSIADFKAVGLSHVLKQDSSLNSLWDLEAGWEAERADIASPWRRSEYFPGKD